MYMHLLDNFCHTCVYKQLDGHHKLIRWKIVTHGAIDGYSRLVVFLQASNNNRASTVYEYFIKAIRVFGLPSRIRTDQGRENVTVARHMLQNRGLDRNSVLVGSSVHNQRIERLWKDMHRCVTIMFYRLFYYLEQHDMLNPINNVHLFALHYVFLPRINRALKDFVSYWNHHGIRTQAGLSPHQLFTAGMLRLQNSGLTAMDFFDVVNDSYGDEEEGLVGDDDDTEDGVTVPPLAIELSDEQTQQLTQQINPLEECEDYGVNLYEHTIDFLDSLGITS